MPTRHGNVVVWATDVDQEAIEQAARAARPPFVRGHVALMPDAHVGLGATIGSVIPTAGAVMPAAVGVDIECGMVARETSLTSRALLARRPWEEHDRGAKKTRTAAAQFGSLGSGDHFVEVCLDERDHVWSCSTRGRVASATCSRRSTSRGPRASWRSSSSSSATRISPTPSRAPEFDANIRAMPWAQDYAMENREAMIDAVVAALGRVLGTEVGEVDRVNCHHNLTEREQHHGQDVWLTHKGAIRARTGDRGVIPGSMGTRSSTRIRVRTRTSTR